MPLSSVFVEELKNSPLALTLIDWSLYFASIMLISIHVSSCVKLVCLRPI